MFVASAFSTLEDNYSLKKFAKEIFNSDNIFYIPSIDESFGDDILRRSDKTPNSNGLKLLGIKEYSQQIFEMLSSGKIKLLYILNEDISRLNDSASFFKNIQSSVQQITYTNEYSSNANVIFPVSSYAEINGTFVNFQNRIQRVRPAVTTLEQERLIGEFQLSRWDKMGAHNDRWTHGTKFNARPGWKIISQLAKVMGHEFKFENTEEVFVELCSTVPELNGYDYDAVGSKGIVAGEKILIDSE